jgi:Tfp pilus assembly protein PilV
MTALTPRLSATTSLRAIRGGFTLAEAMIASVFLAVAVLGVASALCASSNQARQVDESSNAQALARELLEEIASKSFTTQSNAGWAAGTHSRASYDDVADYNGYTDNTTDGIVTLQGTAITLGDNVSYTRVAAFEYRATPGGTAQSSGDFGMATVTVTTPNGTRVSLQRMLTNPVYYR